MAKWGEGDARWQVADMGEGGRNVNNWHWTEKDALPWCRERLTELLGSADLAPGSGLSVRGTGVKSCEGEAVVNNRKNKIIAAYELSVTLGWEGSTADGTAVTGEVRLPYVSEENHDEDPEMQVATSTEGPAAQQLKAAILGSGKKVVHDAVAVFVKELRAGGPMRSGAAQPKAAPAKSVDAAASEAAQGTSPAAAAAAANGAAAAAAAGQQAEKEAAAAAAAKKEAAAAGGSGDSIELKERFYAGAAELFECFTVPPRMMAYTQSPAEAEPQPGGKFSLYGGSVQGVFREVVPNQRIVMDWRFSNWEDGAYSRVELRFEEPDRGNTIVTLKQTGIPDADRFGHHDVVGTVESGWRQQVFDRIRRPAAPAAGRRAARRPAAAAAAPRDVRARVSRDDVEDAIATNPLFNNQFMGVLRDSLARQGSESLTRSAQPEGPRTSATEEVLTTALAQSKQSLQQLMMWREQIDRQIAAQQKQVDRMEFALNKSRGDAAYLRALKEMMHGDM
ncbi:hypothetical protein COHA_005346 [Chlorella ohadii]|uniref:Activator of Hsp90 ATPase AHSA1-like N-terminal domain-containing protein n=1 Tax=Chlorella ohadii TaxID=2649997 RepID=A0AAD5DV24_9CHLO|nr:hypothetical protein COHA_005346 [Chlorella ohadii]